MMLEDDFTYVLSKTLKGLTLAPSEVAKLAGLLEGEVLAFSRGNFSADVARKLAPVLGLNPEALANHATYSPRPLARPDIHRIDMPFAEERVNAWLVQADDVTLLFDTGYISDSCEKALGAMNIEKLDQIFITHEHPDHVGGISSFFKKGIPLHGSNIQGAAAMLPGEAVHCGSLKIRACDLSGHAVPSLGYLIEGLDLPILVTGDALFAGSMGGCATPERYQLALKSLKKVLSPLTDQTILLPGHGPATTLSEERVSNPFL
jgi:hydroxyacylglutathione hydrolase